MIQIGIQTRTGSRDERFYDVRGVGALAAGAAVLPGTASANEVSTVAFCGCSQVVVYGDGFARDGTYLAVLYCGDLPEGEVSCVELTGGDTERSYEIEDEDCKPIGLIGTTFREGQPPTTDEVFIICNTYGLQQYSQRVLDHYDGEVDTECAISTRKKDSSGHSSNDPEDIVNTFTNVTLRCDFDALPLDGYGYPEDLEPKDFNIAIRSGGCGPEDSGPPGGDPGPPNRDGDSGGDERRPPERGGGPPGQSGPP